MPHTNEEMLHSLQELLRIASVSGHNANPDQPYGKEVDAALNYTLKLCESLGMRTTKIPGKTAWAEAGQGEEMIAIIPHLDVVPAGEGWTVEPFNGTIKDGKLYGRGSSDNKGPAISCIYAVSDILEETSGRLPRRVRLIFGQSEETGIWHDMEYYRENEEKPVAGFTPDAEFPALSGEKGMLWVELATPIGSDGLLQARGGTACNIVAAQCEATYADSDGRKVKILKTGKAAHATVPDRGINAIAAAMQELYDKTTNPLVAFHKKYIRNTCHGELLGIDMTDEPSGRTTLCVGMLNTSAGKTVMTMDIRYPVTADRDEIVRKVKDAADSFGVEIKTLKDAKPLYYGENHPILQEVLSAYRDETKDFGKPIVIGGGTYARAVDNIVGFGAAFPGHIHTEHQNDEYVELEDFYLQRKIYRSAIRRLLKMKNNRQVEP